MPTGVAKYPYPQPTAVPDVPADLLLLTQRLALMNGAGIGYVADAAELTATITNSDAFTGWSVYHAAADCVVRYNGAAFKISGTKRFASNAAQTSWTSTYSGLLEADALSITTDTGITYRYNGSAWKAWSSDWTAFTPTLTGIAVGTGGNAANSGMWKYEGGRIRSQGTITLGTTGSSVSGSITVTLPVTALALRHQYQGYAGLCSFFDVSATTNYFAFACAAAASVTAVQILSPGTNGLRVGSTATVPFTWAAGDAVSYDFQYDPA